MDIRGAFSGFSTDNIEQMKRFYGSIMGFEMTEEMGGIRLDIPGGQQVFIYQKENHQPATFTVLNFVVDDIDAAIDKLVGQDVTFEHYDNLPGDQDARGVLRGKDVGMGPNIAWFKDPSGNILSLVEQ